MSTGCEQLVTYNNLYILLYIRPWRTVLRVTPRITQSGRLKESTVAFRLDNLTKRKLNQVANDVGLSISDLVRLCIKSELPKLQKKYDA